MDNDMTLSRETAASTEPVGAGPMRPPVVETAAVSSAEREHSGVFASLVKDDNDITGLVAYSIYKQNKLDWLQAFEAAKGRAPGEPELGAYIIGEGTPRRLATYRHLAEATLAGRGPEVEGTSAGRTAYTRPSARNPLTTPALLATYCVIAVLFVIAFWMAAHYTLAGR